MDATPVRMLSAMVSQRQDELLQSAGRKRSASGSRVRRSEVERTVDGQRTAAHRWFISRAVRIRLG